MCQNRIIWENLTCRDLRHRHFWSRWPTMVGIVLCVIALHCVYVVLIHWKSKYRNTAILKENHFHFLLACIQENVHQTIILSIQYFFKKKKLFWKFLMTFLHEFNKEFVLLWVFFFRCSWCCYCFIFSTPTVTIFIQNLLFVFVCVF